ncbi:MAG: dienelactone hydrolase family protein [Candidatus Rokubacteria bacterium]|nr:dienelactone hydrolase family protein [Candidatus Rokubacteria bacterium]
MDLRTETIHLATADGKMPVYLFLPSSGRPHPAVIVVMEAFGLNGHIKDVAERIVREGYVTTVMAGIGAVIAYLKGLKAQGGPRRADRHHGLLHGRTHGLPLGLSARRRPQGGRGVRPSRCASWKKP